MNGSQQRLIRVATAAGALVLMYGWFYYYHQPPPTDPAGTR
jgi:hypothetical protein